MPPGGSTACGGQGVRVGWKKGVSALQGAFATLKNMTGRKVVLNNECTNWQAHAETVTNKAKAVPVNPYAKK